MSQLISVCAYICLSSIIHVVFPDSCNFLFECSQWTHDKYWTRTRYGQINGNMPKTDHTFGIAVGKYLYFNNTSTKDQLLVAKLQSKALKQPHTCLIFWYSMYESDVQYLKVFRISGESRTEIWNKTGNLPIVWNEAKVEFSYDGEFTLVFEGTKTSVGHMALDDISVTGVCPDTSTGTQSTTEAKTSIGDRDSKEKQLSFAAIIGSVVGSLVFVVVLVFVAVCICRKKQCSNERNEVNTILQLPSYETLQHGGNTGDYLHVVYSSNASAQQNSNVPFPHDIISNNGNEYDYVSQATNGRPFLKRGTSVIFYSNKTILCYTIILNDEN